MSKVNSISLETSITHEEQVYGRFWIKLLYGSWLGRLLSAIIALPFFSAVYGWLQDRPASSRKVGPFIDRFDIQMSDFLPEDGRSEDEPFSTFNQFFTRRVTESARPFAQGSEFPAPCDARYFAYETLNDAVSIPVKGAFFKASALVASDEWNRYFEDGPGFIARLCPVDYHRFHYPDHGEVLASWRIPGALIMHIY